MRQRHIRQCKWLVKLLGLFSLAVAILAVVMIASGDRGPHIRMLIAVALGVGLAVFIGTAFSLTFLSSSKGHDAKAAKAQEPLEQ